MIEQFKTWLHTLQPNLSSDHLLLSGPVEFKRRVDLPLEQCVFFSFHFRSMWSRVSYAQPDSIFNPVFKEPIRESLNPYPSQFTTSFAD